MSKLSLSLQRYDAAIFGEPTDMGFASAIRGSMRAVMRSHGHACHASRPWEGKNACDAFARDLQNLRCIDMKVRLAVETGDHRTDAYSRWAKHKPDPRFGGNDARHSHDAR